MQPITLGHSTSIWSAVLDVDRPLQIYTPAGYEQSADAYPVLYLLDGQSHFLHASGVTQFLSRVGRMPEMIVVAVGNIPGPNGRTNNMTPLPTDPEAEAEDGTGGGSDFLAFLRDELQPWVENQYRTAPFRVLVGHSLGGLFATQVLVEDPGAFQAYISISPSLWWDDGTYVAGATSIFEDHPDMKGALYMTMGNEGGAMLAGGWSLASILETSAPESFRWKWTHMPEETHGSVPHRSLYDGLEWLFDGWTMPNAATLVLQDGDDGWRELNEHYSELSERLGYDVKVPEDVVDAAGRTFLEQGRFEEAVVAFERSSELYPGSARAFNHLGDVYRMICRWDESKENYATAYAMAQEMSFPNVDNYRDELARITAQIESGNECTVPGSRTEIEVPEHVLATYVGEYELGPGRLVVTLEGGALFAQPRGQQKAGLFAESETEFFLKIVDAQVSFTKDDSGAVTGMILHQNGRDQPGRKVR